METKNLLLLILILVFVIYLSAFAYVMVAYVAPMSKKRQEDNQVQNIMNNMMMNNLLSMMNNQNNQNHNKATPLQSSSEMDSPQTVFFKKSVDHAEKVLFENVFLDGYRYRRSVDLTKIDDTTKKSIVVAMKYMLIDPINSRSIEQTLRSMSEQESVPLWFVVLHEAIRKLIPIENVTQLTDEELLAEIDNRKLNKIPQDNSGRGKVIPINQVA